MEVVHTRFIFATWHDITLRLRNEIKVWAPHVLQSNTDDMTKIVMYLR